MKNYVFVWVLLQFSLSCSIFADKNEYIFKSFEVALKNKDIAKNLDISKKGINKIPFEIKYLTNLEKLDLSNNNIDKIPFEIKYLTNLEKLDLSNNKIDKIPFEIKYLTNLEKLVIKNTNITKKDIQNFQQMNPYCEVIY